MVPVSPASQKRIVRLPALLFLLSCVLLPEPVVLRIVVRPRPLLVTSLLCCALHRKGRKAWTLRLQLQMRQG